MRRTDFIKAKNYTGQKIKNATVSLKIDGVRILVRDGKMVTRNNKVPPGLEIALTEGAKEKIMSLGDVELYNGDFLSMNGTLAQHNPVPNSVDESMVYDLINLDERLDLYKVEEINHDMLQVDLKCAVDAGYEGLVIRTDTDHWYRVKPVATADVYVTGFFEEHDKHGNPKGQLGGFDTNYGKVTAFSSNARIEFWRKPETYVGKMITVQFKELYWTGKFRYCVKFLNFRTDKTEESFDIDPPPKRN